MNSSNFKYLCFVVEKYLIHFLLFRGSCDDCLVLSCIPFPDDLKGKILSDDVQLLCYRKPDLFFVPL